MELTNGDKTVTCYPVIGAGHYGWCAVGNGQDSSKEVKQYLLKLERLCWTELGVLQLPLLSRGCFPQQEIDGRPHGYSVFKRVRRMMVVVMESKFTYKHDSLLLEEKEL